MFAETSSFVLTPVGPKYDAAKAALTALLKAAECSSRNWKYYCLKWMLNP